MWFLFTNFIGYDNESSRKLEPLMQSEKFIEWENGFGHGGAGHLKQHYEHKP